MSIIAEQIAIGQAFIEEIGADVVNAVPAVISVHPHLSGKPELIELTFITIGYALSGVDDLAGLTVDRLARHLAETAGVSPWDGPYQADMTREKYQGGYRAIADEYHFLAGRMGIIKV